MTETRVFARRGLSKAATPDPKPDDLLVTAAAPLQPANAVAALLVLDDGRYVMQLRDALPHIFYPSHWGCFGGAVSPAETPLEALRREVKEELEYEIGAAVEFTRFDFDFTSLGQGKVYRIYYEVQVTQEAFHRFVLHEGAGMSALTGRELLLERKVTPYDAFAVWMHMSRRRFTVS
jgi:ADP-ribose pyrophosphatase YjhB (NUDIX family)